MFPRFLFICLCNCSLSCSNYWIYDLVFLRFADLVPISAIVFAISIIDVAFFRIDSFRFSYLTISSVLLGPQKRMTTQIPLETLVLLPTLKELQWVYYNFLKHLLQEIHLMTLDKSSLKIDLQSIIESKNPLIINSEFWDRFRALLWPRFLGPLVLMHSGLLCIVFHLFTCLPVTRLLCIAVRLSVCD